MAARRGPLSTRVEPRRLPVLADELRQLEIAGEWVREDREKLLLLCKEFDISEGPNCFYELALALARKHCVGFQERKPATKWTVATSGLLVVEIERLTKGANRTAGHTAAWAADQLAKRAEWRDFLGGAGLDPGEALRVRYQSFKHDPWASIARNAFKYHKHFETIPEWESELRDTLRNPHG